MESSFVVLIHPAPLPSTMERYFRSNRLTSIDLSRTRNPPLDRTIKVTSVFDSRNSNYLESRSLERSNELFRPSLRERTSRPTGYTGHHNRRSLTVYLE